jgi:hypothetical protein
VSLAHTNLHFSNSKKYLRGKNSGLEKSQGLLKMACENQDSRRDG